MGIELSDTFVFRNGATKTGVYVSFGSEVLAVRAMSSTPTGARTYRVDANYNIYWDKRARFEGLPHMQQGSLTVDLDSLDVNLYERLYEALRGAFRSSHGPVDSLSNRAHDEPPATSTDDPMFVGSLVHDDPTAPPPPTNKI